MTKMLLRLPQLRLGTLTGCRSDELRSSSNIPSNGVGDKYPEK